MRLSKNVLFCLAALWVAFLVAGPQSVPAAEGPANEAAVSYDTPLARYGDLEFSLGYFFYYTRAAKDKLQMVNRVEGEERKQMIKNALDESFFEHLVVKEAEKNGFKDDPEYKTHVRDMQNDWLTRLYEYHVFYQKYQPDEKKIAELYEQRKSEFFQQEQFSFRHIFFRTIDRTEAEQADAKVRAEAALALIKAGSDFEEVSKEYSDSDRKGNVIGPMTPSKYNPEKPLNPTLEEALLALKPGEVSEIVPTKYGFEILRLESLTPETYQPLDAVKTKLIGEQRTKDFEQWKKNLLQNQWNTAVIQFSPDVIFKQDADPNDVIFNVGGQVFTMADYAWFKGRDTEKKADESEEQFYQRRVNYLKNTVLYRFLVAGLARELKYDQIPFYIERIKTLENFQTYMAWWNRLLTKQMEEHPNTDAEKKAFYEENQARFLQNQTAHVAEMTFNLPTHDVDNLYEVHKAQLVAEEKAKSAIKRVKDGEEFAKVAREMSESETAKNGGDLGVIAADTSLIPRVVSSQAIRLATGEICAEPILNDKSYYVVTCYDKPPREPIPFETPDVQTSVDRGLTNKKNAEFQKEYMAKLFDPAKVELLYPDLYTFNPVNLTPPSLNPPGEEKAEASAETKEGQ